MSALQTLGKMLGLVGEPQADILTNAPAARAVLSRRNLFAGAAALAGGKVFSGEVFAPPVPEVITWPVGVTWEHFAVLGEYVSIYVAAKKALIIAEKF